MKKKFLTTMVTASLTISSLGAIEIYREGDNLVDIYGTIRGVAGYGHTYTGNTSTQSDILFGLQGNSRVGINFKYNGFIGGALVGANEKTFLNSTGNTPGFRQLYGGYDFGNYGTLIIGKIETLTTANNSFSSDIFNTDGGANGYGGYSTSTRRFQVQYKLPIGLAFAISENEKSEKTGNNTNTIPRVAVSYTHKSENLFANIAATYAYIQQNGTTRQNAVGLNIGVKPSFGNHYISTILSYGMNGDLIGEQQTITPSISNNMIGGGGEYTYNRDVNRYAGYIEYGYTINPALKAIIGGGFQLTHSLHNLSIRSYMGMVQLPYTITKNFSIIPQVGYNATEGSDKQSGIFALAQARFTL